MPTKRVMSERLVQLLRDNGYVVSNGGAILQNNEVDLPVYLGRLDLGEPIPPKVSQVLQDLTQPFCSPKSKE